MDPQPKSRSRRAEIRKNRPDAAYPDWQQLKAAGVPAAAGIAVAFFVVATFILLLRQDVVPYRPDQPVTHDIVARVRFTFSDKNILAQAQRAAAEKEPRVYAAAADADPWAALERDLKALPERVSAVKGEVPPELKDIFDPGAVTALLNTSRDGGRGYRLDVEEYVKALRAYRNPNSRVPLLVLDDTLRKEDVKARRDVRIGQETFDPAGTYSLSADGRARLRPVLLPLASGFTSALQPKVVDFTLATLLPTHALDERATAERRNRAVEAVSPAAGDHTYVRNQIIVPQTPRLLEADWQILRAENQAYVASLKGSAWKPKLGLACLVMMMTAVLAAYVAFFQPRVVRNHLRAAAIAGLLLSMLLLAALAGTGNGPIYLFGVAPTLLVAMILAIAYDRRFAMGVASMHGLLATVALNQGVEFFAIQWVGILTAAFLMTDIRSRSKLVEVGGAASLMMTAVAVAVGLLNLEPPNFILKNALYTALGGLLVGCITLSVLPFIERTFRITTSMTLLELADVSRPLLRRLAVEAPGTYSHSLHVAMLAEAAADAVGANALLSRVGSYYHDVGKINKADYFVENQTGGENRHLNLNPSVSFYIITGHVKDGVELAREYNLPTSLVPFIQQHHGTTLVEYFYRQACAKQSELQPDGPAVADHEYRYPGPKPRSKEVAIVMIADAVESATRCMAEPTAGRVENLVHELALRRLLDGQFDECDLTTRDLDRIERAMAKTIMSIYHGRIAYPSTSDVTGAPAQALAPVRSA